MKRLLAEQVDQLLAFFQPHCRDTETLQELRALLHDQHNWIKAHYLSTRIRTKAISAVKQGDLKAEMQFSFEETCAKTLHNLTDSKRPFEADTAYWILPQALKLAKTLDLDQRKILDIAMS